MTEKEMYEKSFQRPKDYFKLSNAHQYAIDSRLGILDWQGTSLTKEEIKRYKKYYENWQKTASAA